MLKKLSLSILAVGLTAGIALAGGAFNGFPIVGDPGNDICLSFGNNGVCNQFSPAGPNSSTGIESIPADTNSTNQGQQTVLVPSVLLGSYNTRVNRLIGGDFGINLWQRGTTPVSGASPSTAVIGADRWAVYSSTNVVTVIKETATADTIPASGFYASMRVSRPSGTDKGAVCTGQVLDKQASAEMLGNNGVFSFYALAGAGLAAADTNSNITATIAYYTAADSTTPLTNTATFMAGTITGYTAAVGGVSNGTTGTITSGAAIIPISTTWTRYSIWGKIPTANVSGTAITGVGVTICYTPTSGTGGSTEWFEVTGAQLQAMPSTVSNASPNGITVPTGFERRPAQLEADYQQYYSFSIPELTSLTYPIPVLCSVSGTALISIPFNGQMRETPTVAVTAGGFSIQTAVAKTAIGTTTLATANASYATLTSAAACTTTLPYQLVGTNTTGLLMFSAEP